MANQYLFTKYLSWRKRRGEVVKEEEEEKGRGEKEVSSGEKMVKI